MNPDVAITIILVGEVALLGIASGIATWRAARPLKDSESTEKWNRVLAADNRLRDREAAIRPSANQWSGGGDAIRSPDRLKWTDR
jgi:hypothetical protein